jgi:hypothetical protein
LLVCTSFGSSLILIVTSSLPVVIGSFVCLIRCFSGTLSALLYFQLSDCRSLDGDMQLSRIRFTGKHRHSTVSPKSTSVSLGLTSTYQGFAF